MSDGHRFRKPIRLSLLHFPLRILNMKAEATQSYRSWHQLRFDWVVAYSGAPTSRVAKVESSSVGAWRIERGEARVVSGDHEVRAVAGEWIVNGPGRRLQEFSPDARIWSARVNLSRRGAVLLLGHAPSFRRAGSGMRRSHRLLRELLGAARPIGGRRMLLPDHRATLAQAFQTSSLFRALTAEWLSAGFEEGWTLWQQDPADPRVARMVELLESWPLDQRLDLPAIAARLDLGPAQACRILRRSHGRTPRRYFEQRRVDAARFQLAEGATVKEVASGLGFRSLQQFSAWFRTHEGVGPREFRSGARG